MKKIFFLILLALLGYISVMYKSPALMILALTQFFLGAAMFGLSFYLKRNLHVSFAQTAVSAICGAPFSWVLRVENRGRIPVSRFTVGLRMPGEKKRKKKKRKISGSSDCGESFLPQEDRLSHCGLQTLELQKVKVYDHLSLFCRRQRSGETLQAVVFPQKHTLRIRREHTPAGRDTYGEKNAFLPGVDYGEIRQIREYREGDPVRHIHWNQTARSGEVWIREYEEEKERQIRLFLDRREAFPSAGDADAFYTVLEALLCGLLEQETSIQVLWTEKGNGEPAEESICDESDCHRLLFRLYQAGNGAETKVTDPALRQRDLCLTADLCLSAGDRRLFQFSKENLEAELSQQVFNI